MAWTSPECDSPWVHIMKVILYGKNATDIIKLVEEAGFDVVEVNPEYVVTYGGDGTLMRAEEIFPGIPKIVLRDSAICKKCSKLSNEEVLRAVKNNQFHIEEQIKLSVVFKGKELIGFNDITVHNADARRGIRYRVSIDDVFMEKEIIGDGIVVATPFGSTAYYRSITDSYFEVGIGLAFNNSTEQADHIVIKDDSVIELVVTRGPVTVYADNKNETLELKEGDSVVVKKSNQIGRIVIPDALVDTS